MCELEFEQDSFDDDYSSDDLLDFVDDLLEIDTNEDEQ